MISRRKVLVVIGTRPEAIKMSPLISLLQQSSMIEVVLCTTSQHKDMVDRALDLFSITPDFDLKIMKENQDLYDITTNVMLGMKQLLKDVNPSLVLVHGDTTTAFSAALAAFYSSVLVGHIEAGLRTNDLSQPFPEEFNRQIISKIASIHFAPTENARQNLLVEKIKDSAIHVTGNTVIDALMKMLEKIERDFKFKDQIIKFLNERLLFDWQNQKFILITGHRRENFGAGFMEIIDAIKKLSESFPEIHFIYPVHLNPNVRGPIQKNLSKIKNIHLLKPLEYEFFVYLLKHCHIVLTDSGGIQEEAPSLGKPVLVMRGVTERPEGIQAGTVRLVGANSINIIKGVTELLSDVTLYEDMSRAHNPYGDGSASQKIIDALENSF